MTKEVPHRLEIGAELARSEGVPDDLDATQREPYTIPSTRRRRRSGWVYASGAVLIALAVAAGLPSLLLGLSTVLVVMGMWHFVSAWRIEVLDPEALDQANRSTNFAVGHASAAVGFDTWRARPIWNVLVFSADDPPSRRGLVRVDAVDGHVVETYTEEIVAPE